MRITSMQQMAKGLPNEASVPDVASALESTKWYLWHGNVLHALQRIDDLDDTLELLEENPTNKNKLKKAVQCRPAYRS